MEGEKDRETLRRGCQCHERTCARHLFIYLLPKMESPSISSRFDYSIFKFHSQTRQKKKQQKFGQFLWLSNLLIGRLGSSEAVIQIHER